MNTDQFDSLIVMIIHHYIYVWHCACFSLEEISLIQTRFLYLGTYISTVQIYLPIILNSKTLEMFFENPIKSKCWLLCSKTLKTYPSLTLTLKTITFQVHKPNISTCIWTAMEFIFWFKVSWCLTTLLFEIFCPQNISHMQDLNFLPSEATLINVQDKVIKCFSLLYSHSSFTISSLCVFKSFWSL